MADENGVTPPAGGAPDNTPPGNQPPAGGEPAKGGEPSGGEPAKGGEPSGGEPAKGDEPAKGSSWAELRTKYAKGDEKLLNRLSRYSSAEDALDALVAAQNKISAVGLREAKPDPKDAEAMAKWRADNGLPETPDKYELGDLPEGFTKENVAPFLELAHGMDLPADKIKSLIAFEQQRQAQAAEARAEADRIAAEKGTEELAKEWGTEFKLNKNLIRGLLDGAPADVRDGIYDARLADGTPLMSHPSALRWLASLAREQNPTATVVPGSGTNQMQAIESELATLRKMSADRSPTSEYWHGPKADANQKRMRELLDVEAKLKKTA